MELKMKVLIQTVFFICSTFFSPSEEKVIVKRDLNNFLTDILDELLVGDVNNQSTASTSSTPVTFPTAKKMDSTTSSTTRYSSSSSATQSTSTMSTTTGSGSTTSTTQGTTTRQTTTSAEETTSFQTTASAKTTTTTAYKTTTPYKTTPSDGSTTAPPQSSSSLSTTRSTITTTTTDNPSCHTKQILSDVCSIPMPGILKSANIWDIYYMLFSDSIVEALLINCPSGKWCLQDEFNVYKAEIMEKVEIISSSKAFSLVCEDTTLKCVQEATGAFQSCDVSPTINFTSDAISLLCSVQDLSKIEDDCLQELLVSFHVSIMDIVRRDLTKPDLNQEATIVCDTTEAKMARTYMCTRSTCPALQDKLSRFRPWQWFLSDVSVLQSTCSIPVDICQSTSTQSTTMIDDGAIVPTSTNSYDSSDEPLKGAEDSDENSSSRTIFIGVSAGVVFAVVVLFTIAVEFCRRIKKEESKKEGYRPLISKDS